MIILIMSFFNYIDLLYHNDIINSVIYNYDIYYGLLSIRGELYWQK